MVFLDFRVESFIRGREFGGSPVVLDRSSEVAPSFRVPIAEFLDPAVAVAIQIRHDESTFDHIGEQSDKHARVEAFVNPVVDLDKDRGRDDQGLVRGLEERPASRVVSVAAIQSRIQRPSIED